MLSNSWQRLTLANLRLSRWRSSSFVYQWVGLIRHWYWGSWLLPWGEPIGAALVVLVLVLSPFVSTALIGVLCGAIAAWWLLLTLTDQTLDQESDSPGATPVHLMVLLYWFIAFLATGLSPVKGAAAVGLGRFTLYLFVFVLMARVMRSSMIRNMLISVFLHVSLVVSTYGISQWFSGVKPLATWVDPDSPLKNVTRVYSYLENPNLLAAYLVPAIALSLAAIFVWQRWLPRLLAITMAIVNTTCLMLTFSRGGWIGLVCCGIAFVALLGFWYSYRLPEFWRRWLIPITVGGTVLIILGTVVVVPTVRARVLSIFLARQDTSNNFRLNVWNSVIQMIRARPVLGIGPGNTAFNLVYPLYQQTRFTALSAYSVFLEIAVETGLIGLAGFVWLLLVVFNQGMQRFHYYRRMNGVQGFWLAGAIAGMVGMLGHGLVDTVWYRPQVSLLWWLLVAVVTSYYTTEARSQSKGA